ncbi:MAG: response regulator [Leptolyngbya sp. SIOISBB]|nr:response regulator [Leptolyngbya sp. SIOISBB]
MSSRFGAWSRVYTARLSWRIVLWVFLSIIVIEVLILVPAAFRREREKLLELQQKCSLILEAIANLNPSTATPQRVMADFEQAREPDLVLGGVLYKSGTQQALTTFGEVPDLDFEQALTAYDYYYLKGESGEWYDVAWQPSQLPNHHLVVRLDASSVNDFLRDYVRNIALLILLISVFVTAGTMVALGPLVLDPILRLRRDLKLAEELITHDRSLEAAPFLSHSRQDELGDVITAFQQMLDRISHAFQERKQTAVELEQMNTQLVDSAKQLEQANAEIGELNDRLQLENQRLADIDRIKTDFISTVSHELRTPLTSVLGFAKLIQKKLDDVIFPAVQTEEKKTQRAIKQVSNNIDIIVAEGERLTALINDVLDIAKMEAGKVEWKMEPLAIATVLERAIAATASLFEQKSLPLHRDFESDLPEIMGDRDRLIQVVINLLSNAVKFTDEGSITCRVKPVGDQIRVSVIDTGLGIRPADQPQVFERFKQIGDTLTDKPKGTGLGLPICKQIVEHHGGSIWVEGDLGQGSTFTFSLPCPATQTATLQPLNIDAFVQQLQQSVRATPIIANPQEKHILVVDDDANIRELLRQELTAQGYHVEQAANGLEAINQVKCHRPHLIVMDVMMPQMGGLDAAAVLKSNPDTMEIPIIILSILENQERGFKVGIDRYINKPIDTDGLLSEIDILLAQGASKKACVDCGSGCLYGEALNQNFAVERLYRLRST